MVGGCSVHRVGHTHGVPPHLPRLSPTRAFLRVGGGGGQLGIQEEAAGWPRDHQMRESPCAMPSGVAYRDETFPVSHKQRALVSSFHHQASDILTDSCRKQSYLESIFDDGDARPARLYCRRRHHGHHDGLFPRQVGPLRAHYHFRRRRPSRRSERQGGRLPGTRLARSADVGGCWERVLGIGRLATYLLPG